MVPEAGNMQPVDTPTPEFSETLGGVVVLVTGAGSGIGRELCMRLLGEGARVGAVDISGEALTSLQSDARSASGDLRCFQCDLRADDAVRAMLAEAYRWQPAIDSIVHSAGVGRYAPFLELTEADWHQMLDVNLLGAVRLARYGLPEMKARRKGQFVIIGSRRGSEPAPHTSAYSASKAAVAAFALTLGLELSDDGIHLCLIAPGGVRTGFGGIPAEGKEARFLEPGSVAECVLHVLRNRGNAWVRELTVPTAWIVSGGYEITGSRGTKPMERNAQS